MARSSPRTHLPQQLFLIAAAALAIAALLAGWAKRSRPTLGTAPSAAQNVLLITIDTLRADHIGCYGYKAIQTPNLDSLAARGTRFAEAVTAVPLTLPAHASILTGTYPPVHAVRDMGGFVLGESPPTLATILARAGFHTAAFVGSFTLDHRFGINRGFQVYDDQMPSYDAASSAVGEPERRADLVADRAIAWLGARPPGRFLLWVHFFDPHTPYSPPQPFLSQNAGRPYDGEIAYTDSELGRLLEALRTQELLKDTLIAVLGDHGESLGEHGESTHGIFLYDGAVRIPMILAGAGVPPGKVVYDQVRSIDLMPTILGVVGLPGGEDIQGISLWPLMKGQANRPPEARFAYLETVYPRTHFNWSELRAVRTRDWKYIQAPQEELYDLRKDKAETNNTLRAEPAVSGRYRAILDGILGQTGHEEVLRERALTSETRQELASLGYVSTGLGHPLKLDRSRPDPKTQVSLLHDFEAAIELMGRRDYRRAAQRLEFTAGADPANPLFWLRLGICYQLGGNSRAALATYERALRNRAETDEMLYRYGNLLMDQRDFRRAATAFERALALNPEYGESRNNLGICYLELGRLNDAEATFRKLLAQDTKKASAYNSLGLIFIKQGRRAEGAEQFQKALVADPHFWEAWLNLGIYHQEAGQSEQAIHCLEEFARGAPPERFKDSIDGARQMVARLRASAR